MQIMRAQIKPIHQIQRVNLLVNQLEEMKQIDTQLFMKRPKHEAWCGAEVLKHMILGQQAYTDKVDRALKKAKPVRDEVESITPRFIPSFLIKRFPPIDGEIRHKMKTTKRFKPMLDPDNLTTDEVHQFLSEMKKMLEQLSVWVEKTRKKDVRPIRFNSAIGPIVRFNASEACEFILCHNERHFQQLNNAIRSAKEKSVTA